MVDNKVRVNRSGQRVVSCDRCGKVVRSEKEAVWHSGGLVLCEQHDTEFRRVQTIELGIQEFVFGY